MDRRTVPLLQRSLPSGGAPPPPPSLTPPLPPLPPPTSWGSAPTPPLAPPVSATATTPEFDKTPQPLLARRQRTLNAAVIEGEVTEGGSSRVDAPFTGWRAWVWRVILIAWVLVLAFSAQYFLKETRLELSVMTADDFRLEGAALVRDFRPDILELAQEWREQRAPMLSDVTQARRQQAQAQADAAGKEEKRRLIQQSMADARTDMDRVVNSAKSQADELWQKRWQQLQVQYDERLHQVAAQIRGRAAQLKVKYELDEKLASPEAWANAFRLALYDPPKGVNGAAERDWAESVVAEWRQYMKDWQARKEELKQEATRLQASSAEPLKELQGRLEKLSAEETQLQNELVPIQEEVRQQESRVTQAVRAQEALEAPLREKILQVPTPAILMPLTLSPEGHVSWRELQRQPQFAPGVYLLWIRATRQGQVYWSFVPFAIRAGETTQLLVEQGAFLSLSQVIDRTARAGE